MSAPSSARPGDRLPQRFADLAVPDGMPLLIIHGDACFVGDHFVGDDLVPVPLRDVLWQWLRNQGWTRIAFHTMEQTLFTLDPAQPAAHDGSVTSTVAAEGRQPRGRGERIRGPLGAATLLTWAETAPPTRAETAPLGPAHDGVTRETAAEGPRTRGLHDQGVVDQCANWMRAADQRTAVVFLESENWLVHGRAQRAFADAFSHWFGPDAVPGNLCVLVFNRRTLDEVRELVDRAAAFPNLLGVVESLQGDQAGTAAPGRFAVGPPDAGELERFVHARRLRGGLRVDFTQLDVTLRTMTAARRPVRDWATRLVRLASQPAPGGVLSPKALLDHGWAPAGAATRSAVDRLAGMVGLTEVKRHVERVRRAVEFAQERAALGHPIDRHRLNLVFSGRPGTGKTTVAELIGEIYRDIGALPIGHVHAIEPSGLVGAYQGWTQRAIETAFEEARGGVLFIDEAYQLSDAAESGSFQRQAISSIVRLMERDRGRLAVVIAGYPEKMEEFLAADAGLARRFPEDNRITFPDYAPAELLEILLKALGRLGLVVEDSTRQTLATVVERIHGQRGPAFGNAGEMEELARAMTSRWLERVGDHRDAPVTVEDLPERFARLVPGRVTESLDDALGRFDRFVGLEQVKRQIGGLATRLRHEAKRHRLGLRSGPVRVEHMLFVGPPGTGKTTVARALGEVLHDLGLLAGGQVIEVTRTDLVAGYLGQTSPLVERAVQRALGGVLFVDEAYNLMSAPDDQYGREATNVLLEEMERHRGHLVVIAAGYPHLIDRWISTNDGLQSRFTYRLEFRAFTTPELVEVLRRAVAQEGYHLPDAVVPRVEAWLDRSRRLAAGRFGNAREARRLLELMVTALAERTAEASDPGVLTTFAPQDVPDAGY